MTIDRLILIAGAKTAGKSLLIQQLKDQSLPALNELIQLGDPEPWIFAAAQQFESREERDRVGRSEIEGMVLHYEITRPWNHRYASGFLEDKPLELLEFAREIKILTLWAPADVLLSRYLDRNPAFQSRYLELRRIIRKALFGEGGTTRNDFRPLFRDPRKVQRVYELWLEFCGRKGASRHWLVDSANDSYVNIRVDLGARDFEDLFAGGSLVPDKQDHA